MPEWTYELRRDPTPTAYETGKELKSAEDVPVIVLRKCTAHDGVHVDGYYLAEVRVTARVAVYEWSVTAESEKSATAAMVDMHDRIGREMVRVVH